MNTATLKEAQALAAAFTSGNPMRLERHIRPSWKAMEQQLRDWHSESLDDPEYLWLEPNFEDMADNVNKAMFCAGTQVDTTPDDSWIARQDDCGVAT